MRTNKFFKTGLLLFVASLGLISCGDDDKEPEIVIDPVSENVEYYIEGKVVADNAALEGVSVTVGEATATTDENGQYSLTVKDKKTYTVSFAKKGYKTVSDASVEIANNATNKSLIALNVTMSKEGVAVTVDPESDKVITEKGEGETEDAQTVLTIPVGAVSTATDVTLTPYLEAVATDVTPGSKEEAIPMTNIAISSSQDAALNQDVTLSVANASSSDYYFDEVEVYEKTNARAIGDWKKYADAAFDKATNSYIAAIKKGSSLNQDYSIRVKSEKNVSETKNDEILKEDSYSNAGNMSATTYDIPYTAKLGWEISASGLDEGALSLVKAAIAAQEGGSEGVYTVNKTFTAHVSGDYILYFSCKAKYVEKEYTFSIAGKKAVAKVKHYLGTDFIYTNQSASMHGGGSMESNIFSRIIQNMSKKVALISGITGQDGSFLAEFLIEKGYEVHGILRRSSSFNTARIEHLYLDEWVRDMKQNRLVNLHWGDMTDSSSLIRIIQSVQPDEIYNLAAQSHVKVSFDVPEYTAEADAVGTLRMLEAVRILGLEKKTKIYQASTSELFGLVQEVPQKETTPFYPRSPYGVAKQYGFWITKNYRESYGMFAVNGILFNHESERRGETFVTRKITLAAARIAQGFQDKLYLGNLNSLRDWGYAKDYVECMWLILQHDTPEDFVIATGEYHTVREFATLAFKEAGIDLHWEGEGVNEKGIDTATGKVLVEVDPKYFRPAEVEQLLGDPTKAKTLLGWNPRKTSFEELVKIMVKHDMKFVKKLHLKASC